MGVSPRLDIAYKAGELAMALCVFSPVLQLARQSLVWK